MRFQQWTRLIRFVAAETSQVHIGQPIDSQLDGGSTVFGAYTQNPRCILQLV